MGNSEISHIFYIVIVRAWQQAKRLVTSQKFVIASKHLKDALKIVVG